MSVSEDYFSIILDFPLREEEGDPDADFCYHKIEGSLGVIYVARSGRPPLSVSQFLYRYIPQLFGLGSFPAAGSREFDPQPLESAGILSVQRPPLELTGSGTVLAVIDTGISYENPAFRYSDGSSRILAIWDQTDQSGQPPEGFFYGTQYTQEQINEALRSDDPHSIVPQRDEIGHGTALASAAAGSRIDGGITFTGAAPDAQIVVVKVKPAKQHLRDYYMIRDGVPAYSTDDLLFAIKYAQQFAVPFERPVVLCVGMGTSMGSHNGGSFLTDYLQHVSEQLAVASAASGGNEGNAAGHFRAALTQDARPVEIRVGENMRGFMLELWGESPSVFEISVSSPGGEVIPVTNLRIVRELDYTFVYEKTRVVINYVSNERNTGDELIVMRFETPSPGIWTIQVRGVRALRDAVFDIWMTQEQFRDGEAAFLTPTPEVTLTMPSYADDAVTLTAYNSANGSFYYNSGQGFSRTGKIKPDLAAPGVAVSTINGPYTGTAMSAAVTAGAMLQLMQWCVTERNAPFASGREIKGYLRRGAFQDSAYEYPNRQWGYGRLDLKGTFDVIAGRLPG